MNNTVNLGSPLGVPLNIHWTTFLLLGVTMVTSGFQSMLTWLLVYTFVFLHEHGHIHAAKLFGYKTHDITMYPIGGVARIDPKFTENPRHEFIIAIRGPLTNFGLALIFYGIVLGIGLTTSSLIFKMLAINLALGIFNLAPVYPMDGGRIFRSFFQIVLKDRIFATKITAIIGIIIAGITIPIACQHSLWMLTFIAIIMLVINYHGLKNPSNE